jgi:hypothetical protein
MSSAWSSRRGLRWPVSVALLVAVLLALPAFGGGAEPAMAQTGVPGLFTCSDGSQSFSGCGGAGIGYCGGALGAPGQPGSGPGIGGNSACAPATCLGGASNACPWGLSVRPGLACGSSGITYPYGEYTYSPLNAIYTPPWYGYIGIPSPAYAGASWKPCIVQGRGFVWIPLGAAAPFGSLC